MGKNNNNKLCQSDLNKLLTPKYIQNPRPLDVGLQIKAGF